MWNTFLIVICIIGPIIVNLIGWYLGFTFQKGLAWIIGIVVYGLSMAFAIAGLTILWADFPQASSAWSGTGFGWFVAFVVTGFIGYFIADR